MQNQASVNVGCRSFDKVQKWIYNNFKSEGFSSITWHNRDINDNYYTEYVDYDFTYYNCNNIFDLMEAYKNIGY